jgi:hypothetical protein
MADCAHVCPLCANHHSTTEAKRLVAISLATRQGCIDRSEVPSYGSVADFPLCSEWEADGTLGREDFMRHFIVVSMAALAAISSTSHEAHAAACCPSANLPSSGSCTTTGDCFDVTNTATSGTAIHGSSADSSGTNYGVEGDNASASGYGVYGTNTASGAGVVGVSSSTTGGSSNVGVDGVTSATSGVGVGVLGGAVSNSSSYGVVGNLGTSITGGGGSGVYGISVLASGYGVYGYEAGATAYGVYGIATGTTGVGVYGTSGSSTAPGVYAVTTGGGRAIHAQVSSAGSGTAVWGDNNSTTAGAWAGYFSGSVNITNALTIGGTCSGTCTSDVRLKKNVRALTGTLEDLVKLRPVTFEWRSPEEGGRTKGQQWGFIAQEVEKVKPEWVGVNDDGFKTINMSHLPVMLVDGVRALKIENDDLRERVKALESGRRPMISGIGEGGIGLGLLAVAGGVVVSRRKRDDSAA